LARIFRGQSYTWKLGDQPIGSGDAGEVFPVSSLEEPGMQGVMKKPAQIATGGTIQRQAGQIAQESMALAMLDGLPKCKAHPPRLLDVAPEYTQGTANFFMVSEAAPGQDMASMLTETRQSGKPFPRRVIITVLDALFDLFARAHRSGVLWNDVKLDHIYWQNPTGQVAVIDWGNAQFLGIKEDKKGRTLPRWEDYQQLVETLGGFLKQYAPDLYADLGWDEFQDKELDLPQVSVLARRIAYQQQVIGLRVMEYQALIRVILSAEPSLEELEKAIEYQRRLIEIGAPWDSEAVLKYSKSLVLKLLKDGNTNAAIKGTSIVWDLFDDSLDLTWVLLREYFRLPDLISHSDLYELANFTLNQNWSSALWCLTAIAREKQAPLWWEHLVPVLRQKAISHASPRPYQTGQSLLEWEKRQDDEGSKKMSSTLAHWHSKGEGLKENPFDYLILDLLQSDLKLPKNLVSEIKTSFAEGADAVRDIIKNWDNMNWDALSDAFRRLICWDPDRWGILYLEKSVEDFKHWLNKLYEGPARGMDLPSFLEQINTDRPRVERVLGSPAWLKSILRMVRSLIDGEKIDAFRMEVTHWCPWLLRYNTLYDDVLTINEDQELVNQTLSHFVLHIKNWSDLEAGLAEVKKHAPQFHPACQKLVSHFHAIANLNTTTSKILPDCQHPAHGTLKESCQVLHTIVDWRSALADQDASKALSIVSKADHQDWQILKHTQKVTEKWIETIQPLLISILNRELLLEDQLKIKKQGILTKVANDCHELKNNWSRIYDSGLNDQLLENLIRIADSDRTNFLEWRQTYEHTSDRLGALLYYYDLERIRLISDNLLRLSQHLRQAQLSFFELREGEERPIARILQAGEGILSHLEKVEQVILSKSEDRKFPGWIEAFQPIIDAKTQETRRDLVLNLYSDHPLYAWLVQSLLTQ
jgi:serine/threonine protein kinase